MKKLLQAVLIVLVVFGLSACNFGFDKENEVTTLEPITEQEIADIRDNVTLGDVNFEAPESWGEWSSECRKYEVDVQSCLITFADNSDAQIQLTSHPITYQNFFERGSNGIGPDQSGIDLVKSFVEMSDFCELLGIDKCNQVDGMISFTKKYKDVLGAEGPYLVQGTIRKVDDREVKFSHIFGRVASEPGEDNLPGSAVELDDVVGSFYMETEEVEEPEEPEDIEETEEVEEIEPYDGPNYIKMITPEKQYSDATVAPVIFQGAVSPNTEKIVVKANGGKGGYQDVYTLKDFKKGDREFTYRANFAWNNLTYGYNDYIFVAYFDDGSNSQAWVSVNFKDTDPRKNPVFDGCKSHVTKYASYNWFPNLSKTMLRNYGLGLYDKIDYVSQADACYSENGKMVIFLLDGEYFSKGRLFKYYTDTDEIFEAKQTNPNQRPDTWMEFGKRNGSLIPLHGYLGDAGYMSEYYYNYDFIKNTVTYVKYRSNDSAGSSEYGNWIYSGQ